MRTAEPFLNPVPDPARGDRLRQSELKNSQPLSEA